jgi:hypothetical protein
VPVTKLIKDLTGDRNLYREVISDAELEGSYKKTKQYSAKKRTVEYKIPELTFESFTHKRMYMRKRTGNKVEIDKIPNLIFNISEFLAINKLDIIGENKTISNYEMDMLQNNFVGFLSEHHTLMYCRSIDENASFKFKKIPLQNDGLLMLDYWAIHNVNRDSNLVILSEGNFDILSEYGFDSLSLKERAKIFASGSTFSYSSLLKSVCFDEDIFKADVIILSDTDKPAKWYRKFLKDNGHIIKTCKIYMNRRGKDFGHYQNFPPLPSQIL